MFALIPMAWRIGIAVLFAIATIGGGIGIYYKIRHTAVVEERLKIEQEKNDAIKKANDAKNILRRLCEQRPDECLRDEWLRD